MVTLECYEQEGEGGKVLADVEAHGAVKGELGVNGVTRVLGHLTRGEAGGGAIPTVFQRRGCSR